MYQRVFARETKETKKEGAIMRLINWIWGLIGTGAMILFSPYAFVFALILSVIDDVNIKEKR